MRLALRAWAPCLATHGFTQHILCVTLRSFIPGAQGTIANNDGVPVKAVRGDASGAYEVWTGFFTGSNPNFKNMAVSEAPGDMRDKDDRVKITTILVE